jgi:glycine betaine/proline transport system substrate-binding protein
VTRAIPSRSLAALALALGAALPWAAGAADAESCATVRMSDPGWTDITSTNALLGAVLEPLGYEQDVETLAVPVTYESLKNRELDAFLGSWQPAQASMLEPLKAAGQVEVLGKNLSGIRFTLAVPAEVAAAGVTAVEHLAAHADQFDRKIYGIDPGAAANNNILGMIERGDHGLEGWELIESSEQAMLGQVDRAVQRDEWIVFLAWEPHPMNVKLDLTYLSGAEEVFGPNYGASDVYTVGRAGLGADCPNLARLLRQVTFTVDMENEIMGTILDQGSEPAEAAAAWLKAHPATVEPWLAGVTTRDGGDGLAAVRAALGLTG